MPEAQVRMVLEHAQLVALDSGEYLTREGDSSDAFFVVVSGRHDVQLTVGDEEMSVATLTPGDVVGETGLLLDRPRGASVLARTDAKSLRFDSRVFHSLSAKVPAFTLAVCRLLARRLAAMPHAFANENDAASPTPSGPAPELVEREFCVRHRVVPVRLEAEVLTVGFVDQPSRMVLNNLRGRFPALEVRVVRINPARFESVIKELDAGRGLRKEEKGTETVDDIEALFRRMVEEGASDLHLSAGHPPCWRIDGDIERLPRAAPFGPDDVLELVGKTLTDAARREFEATNDIDYAYAVEGCGRFRMNLFRDNRGVCAVARHIPQKILTLEQLGMPEVARKFCALNKGMVLVTGPTGSGKSTTLAAMVDYINRTRKGHILTLEDPVEFVHESKGCLVNQRDIGSHTESFHRALKAALREDPDVVLVGEMRDLETIALALEIANTGHLVLGTLHTSTAISTVDRIIDQFPHEQQNQVRTALGESLKGVVSQNLCKKVGGGRVAAVEVMVVNAGVANLIRQGKTHQIANILQTSRGLGNQLMLDELQRLVATGKISASEAVRCSPDPGDTARRLGLPEPE